MLEGPDEDHGSLLGWNLVSESVPVVEFGRHPDAEDPHHLVDRTRGARSREDDNGLLVAADGVPDDLPRVLAQACGLKAGAGRLGVSVGVPGKDLVPDEVFDEAESSTRRGVVSVSDPTGSE